METGRIVGCEGLHKNADVMAKTMQVIIDSGLTVQEVSKTAHQPTTQEILDNFFEEAEGF